MEVAVRTDSRLPIQPGLNPLVAGDNLLQRSKPVFGALMGRRKPVQALLCVVLIATCVSAQKSNTPPQHAAAETQEPQEFGKSYATLRPAQRRLIDDYIRRYNQTTGSKVVAQTAYD